MGSHPNTVLMAVLTPDELSRKTMRTILAENGMTDELDDLVIDGRDYNSIIMEEDYARDYQISASEGDLVFFTHVTYGYGDTVTWDEIKKAKKSLETWAEKMAAKHNCSCKIYVTANYW